MHERRGTGFLGSSLPASNSKQLETSLFCGMQHVGSMIRPDFLNLVKRSSAKFIADSSLAARLGAVGTTKQTLEVKGEL
jgi:hypothetical protein